MNYKYVEAIFKAIYPENEIYTHPDEAQVQVVIEGNSFYYTITISESIICFVDVDGDSPTIIIPNLGAIHQR